MNKEIDNRVYESMLRIRLVEESIVSKYGEGKMRCPVHLSIGQEAISVGVCLNLSIHDMVLSTHRAHAHYLAKGGSLKKMLAEIYGKVTGCSKGMGGSMHLIDKSVGFMGSTAIVGNTIPLAVGLGLSIKLKKNKLISCVFFGDGAIEEGVFYESVNFAIIHKLPVLFICENNLYSVYSNLSVRQPLGRNINEMVRGFGIQSEFGDGNNIEVVNDMVRDAKNRILSGSGPQFLEFETYRWREHCGPNYDNEIGYRSESEYLQWKQRDPLKKYITNNQKHYETIKDNIDREILDAHKFADESPFPNHKDFLESFL